MPAVHRPTLQPRSSSSGQAFTIAFAILAFVVVAGCFIWGFLVPKYRKRHPLPPSQTAWTGQVGNVRPRSAVLHPFRRFPDHPAILRGFRKPAPRPPKQYDPRVETPFPSTPPLSRPHGLPPGTPQPTTGAVTGSINDSSGLFTPARDRVPSRRGWPSRDEIPPGIESPAIEMTVYEKGGNCYTEGYTLAVPEPLVLTAKSAGRAPPLGRQLERFPMPKSESAHGGRVTHPRKLFRELEKRHSTSTSATDNTPTSIRAGNTDSTPTAAGVAVSPHEVGLAAGINGIGRVMSTTDRNAVESDPASETVYETARSQFHRAGTVTRPKTPVAEICGLFDANAHKVEGKSQSFTTESSIISSDLFTMSDHSGPPRISTPPTSPSFDLRALPSVPSSPVFSDHMAPADIAMTAADAPHMEPNQAAGLPSDERLDCLRGGALESQATDRRSFESYHPRKSILRTKPMRLNLSSTFRTRDSRPSAQRHSMSSLGSMLIPLIKSKRRSIHASSVYSHDTRGVSIVRTPTTPIFEEMRSSRRQGGPFSEHTQFTVAPLDILKSKIDGWDLHTGDLDFATSPSSMLKRALSDLGPRIGDYTNQHAKNDVDLGEPGPSVVLPTICVGRTSDDMLGDAELNIEGGRVLKKSIAMEIGECEPYRSDTLGRGTAPGGAHWI